MQVRGVSCQGVSDKIGRFEESLVEESPINMQVIGVSDKICRFEESLVKESSIKYVGSRSLLSRSLR